MCMECVTVAVAAVPFIPSVLGKIKQFLCNHEYMLRFMGKRYAECIKCGHETEGWK